MPKKPGRCDRNDQEGAKYQVLSSQGLRLCGKPSSRTLSVAMSLEPPVASTTVGKKSLTSGAVSGTRRLANRGKRIRWFSSPQPRRDSPVWPWRLLNPAGCLITTSVFQSTGRSSLSKGKDKITIRQLLAHQAGLFALDERVDTRVEADLDKLAVILARQRPAWEPGTRQAYHAITLGFYESELLRRVDPKHRSLGRFFHEEIASPLGLDFYIGLPEDIPNSRLARTYMANPAPAALKAPIPLVLACHEPSLTHTTGRCGENCQKTRSMSTLGTWRCLLEEESELLVRSPRHMASSPPAERSLDCVKRP